MSELQNDLAVKVYLLQNEAGKEIRMFKINEKENSFEHVLKKIDQLFHLVGKEVEILWEGSIDIIWYLDSYHLNHFILDSIGYLLLIKYKLSVRSFLLLNSMLCLDVDGDLVTISSDNELKEAISSVKREQAGILKLFARGM